MSAAFARGQKVVLPGGIVGQVVDQPNEERVRANFLDGHAAGVFYADTVKTRREAMHHMWGVLRSLSVDLGVGDLTEALDKASPHIVAAGDLADRLDAEAVTR